VKLTLILGLCVLGTFAAPEKTRSEIFGEAQRKIDDGLGKALSAYNITMIKNGDGSISCPLPKFIEGVTEETIMEAGKEYHLNPVDFYNVKGSFLHGYQTRFAIEKNGKTDCRDFYECGWRQHVYNGNKPEVKRCQMNAVYQPSRVTVYRECSHCEKDGFGGLAFVEKTGQCVYSPDVKGYFMDHCRSEAGVYVDPLLFEESEQFIINDDEPQNQGEKFDMIEDEKPVEKEDSINDYLDGLRTEESGDIVDNIYGDFELPEYSNDEPSKQTSPQVNWQEEGWQVTESEQFVIDDESKNPKTKVETAEISEPKLEAVEQTIEPELKAEDEHFEETKEFSKSKAEQAEISIEPELKTEVETFEETKELDKFYGFEQAELAEYEADLEAELKTYGKPEEKIWQNTDDSGSI